MRSFLSLAFALVLTHPVLADQNQLASNLQESFPDLRLQKIEKAPIPGWYEVSFREGIKGYVDPQNKYLMLGALVDLQKKQVLNAPIPTSERVPPEIMGLEPIVFKTLPLKVALKKVLGNGKATLVVFSDPECPYCQQLEKTLNQLKDTSIYIFPFPLPIHPQAFHKAAQVYCSTSPVDSWDKLIVTQNLTQSVTPQCQEKVRAILALGESLKITSTPTLFNTKGERLTGGQHSVQMLTQWLSNTKN